MYLKQTVFFALHNIAAIQFMLYSIGTYNIISRDESFILILIIIIIIIIIINS
jgi:hypothetical protein